MKKILIACVNYNTYDYTKKYLDSIEKAFINVKEEREINVFLAENTAIKITEKDTNKKNKTCKSFPYHKNYGYMGGAVKILEDLGETYVNTFDYVIISNVDIELDYAFFTELLRVDSTGLGWIVPSVYRTQLEMSNENPFLLSRPSINKLNAYILMYTFPKLYDIYGKIHAEKQVVKINENCKVERYIFAGMGSIFIFTKELIHNNYPMTFPCFMYGEEIYYGELVRKANLKTKFFPNIKVYDVGGVSTGSLGSKRKCSMNKDSLKIIKKYMLSD